MARAYLLTTIALVVDIEHSTAATASHSLLPSVLGYVIFSALVEVPGEKGHRVTQSSSILSISSHCTTATTLVRVHIKFIQVSIERLTPDYLESTKMNVSDFFPDGFVSLSLV
jgi:hypothetical protein